MSQGWTINAGADTITFYEAPPNGTNNIVVREFASGGGGATDVWALGAWSNDAGWPAEVEYFADRQFFAGTRLQPQTLWASKVGDYSNMGVSVPTADDDPLNFTINARRLNKVVDLVALDNLLPLTAGGEWRMTTNADDIVTPTTVGFKPQTYWGASNLPAQVIGNTAVFVQEKGQKVRDIAYSFTADGYEGGDLTAFSGHLVRGKRLVDVSYSQSPYSVIWYVRDDGTLLGLTYMREQRVAGWHRHDTSGGTYETVCCVPEGDEVATYVGVRRIVNGQVKRYVERFATRVFDHVREAFFVDCGLTYDGRNATATTLTLTGGTNWDGNEELTCTASASLFAGATDVGDQLTLERVVIEGDEEVTYSIRCSITGYTSATQVKVNPIGTVPPVLRGVATATWTFLRDTFSGLGHIEGKTVAVLNDGNVEEQKIVVSGTITLDRPGGVVHVGLPIRAEAEGLDINLPGAEQVFDRVKLIRKITLRVENSRGIKAGPRADYLNEFKQREFEDYDEATQLFTGTIEIDTEGEWDRNGRYLVVQDDPLPLSLLAAIPDVVLGGAS